MAVRLVDPGARVKAPLHPVAGINLLSPHAVGLVSNVSAFHGGPVVDVLSGAVLAGTFDTLGEPGIGSGLRFNANNERAAIVAPNALRIGFPLTLDCWVRMLGTPSATASFFGVTHNTSVASPFFAYGLRVGSVASRVQLVFNTGGTFNFVTSLTGALGTSGLWHLCGVIELDRHTLYINGEPAVQATLASTAPTYDATAELHAGEAWGTQNRNPNCAFLCGRIWRRAYSRGDVRGLYAAETRWDLYQRQSARVFVSDAAPGGTSRAYTFFGAPTAGGAFFGGAV
jgi:hypothetical protein